MSGDTAIPARFTRILALCDKRPRRAVALARHTLANTPLADPGYPWARYTLGLCLIARVQLDAARALLQEAYRDLTDAGDPIGALRARHGLLLADLTQGAGAELQLAWEDLAAALDSHGCALAAAQARLAQMRHLNLLGRSREGLAMAATVQPTIAAQGSPADQATFNRTLGIAYLQVSNFPLAANALARAAHAFEELKLPAELAKTWFEQARVAFYQDDYHTALTLQQRAHTLFTRLKLSMWIAFCEKNIGAIEVKLGRANRAISALITARTTFVSLDMPRHVADCDLNLGNAAYHSGLYELALGTWQRAETWFLNAGVSGMVLVSRRNQASALVRLKNLDAAEALLTDLIPLAIELDAQRDHPEILQDLGELLRDRGAYRRAHSALQQAVVLFTALANQTAVARVQLALGWLYLAEDNVTAAVRCFALAAPGLEVSRIYHWQAVYGMGRCAELQGAYRQAFALYQRASATVVQLRHNLAEAHASSALFREAQQLSAATLRLAADWSEPLVVLQIAEQQRALSLQQQLRREPIMLPPALQADYEARRAKLRTIVAAGGSGPILDEAVTAYLETLLHGRHHAPALDYLSDDTLAVDTLRAALSAQYGNEWTTLTYVTAGELILAVILDPERITLERITLDKPLRRMLERASLPRYRTYIYQDHPFLHGQQAMPWATLAALGERLLPPRVRERLHPAHRLLIVPGDPLHSLPWSALRLNDQWLIEQTVIQLLPGLQHWGDIMQRPRTGSAALLIGISQFGGRANDLPSALPSLNLAQQYWAGKVDRMEEGMVTRAAIQAAATAGELRRYGLIHLATHGQQVAGQDMMAHLKLTDDDLLVDEVAELRLGGALVILAACDGARGESLPGEELLSLNRALLAAGANDVIASLWPLYDHMMLPLLQPLYMALAAGMDAPTALAHAQRACIASGYSVEDLALASPLVWASLCALGKGTEPFVPVGGTTPTDPTFTR